MKSMYLILAYASTALFASVSWADMQPSILWISEHHDSMGDRSILNTETTGCSKVAAIAEEMGFVNIEIDDSTPITGDLLAPYLLVILGVSEASPIRSQVELDAITAYVAEGGRLFVMCGGIGNAGVYANSVSTFFGVTFDLSPTIVTGSANTFFPDLLTEGVSSLSYIGPNFLIVESPAVVLGLSGSSGLLARRDYGAGSVVFWGDDWVFMNGKWEEADNQRFAENLFRLSQSEISINSEEELLVWPLKEGRTWTFQCHDSQGTQWIENREVIGSIEQEGNTYYTVHLTDNYPQNPMNQEKYVRSTDFALFEWVNDKEMMFMVAGPVGVGILNDTLLRTLVSRDTLAVPYGGPYHVYTYELKWINEQTPFMTASFVKGLGFLKTVEYGQVNSPIVKELLSITPDRQCGYYGYPYPEGDMNRDCVINLQDLVVIAINWLECTKQVCP